MPLIHTTDSLPYIDPPPSPNSLEAAATLIQQSLPPASTRQKTLHPSLPKSYTPSFSPLITTELTRLSSPSTTPFTSSERQGVDMSRYSSLPALPILPPTTTTPSAETLEQSSQALKQSYINATYLRLRNEQLGLLEGYGRNAWLIGNDTLEDILREKEKGLVETRGMVEGVNRERKAEQMERGGGEDGVEGLERRWREGVGRGVEVGVAVREVEGRVRRGG